MKPRVLLPAALALLGALAALLGPAVHAQELVLGGRLLGVDGQALDGADVVLRPVPDLADFGREAFTRPAPAATVRSGADGRFELTVTPNRRWDVEIRHDGYLTVAHRLDPRRWPGDLGEVDLPRRHVQPLEVVDAGGRAVADLEIVAVGRSRSWKAEGWRLAKRRIRTGADGRAELPRVPDEQVVLTAVAGRRYLVEKLEGGTEPVRLVLDGVLRPARVVDAAGRPLRGVAALWPRSLLAVGRSGEGGAIELPLVPEARLAPEPVPDGERPPRSRFLPLFFTDAEGAHRGSVRPVETEDGLVIVTVPETRALHGRTVHAVSGEGVAGALVAVDGRLTETDDDGSFTVRVRPDARGSLSVTCPGFAPARRALRELDLDAEMTIPLTPGRTLAGRAVDAAGEGVAGVRLAVEIVYDAIPPGRDLSVPFYRYPGVFSRETGRFTLPDLVPSLPYRLRVTAAGYAPRAVMVAPFDPEASADPLEIVLEAAFAVVGRLVDAEEQPLAGADLYLRPHPEPRGSDEIRHTVAGNDGRFELGDLPAGSYLLVVRSAGSAELERPGVELAGEPGPVDLGTLRLERGAVLEGRVVDPSGRPLAEAGVRVSKNYYLGVDIPGVGTDTSGAFRLPDLPPSGKVSIVVYRRNYLSRSLEVETEPAERLEVVLEPETVVRGRVLDATRQPVAQADVLLHRDELGSSSSMGHRTNDEGRFEFRGEKPGRVTLTVRSDRGTAEPLDLELVAGREAAELEVVLRPASTLRGRILDDAGEPVAAARIWIERYRPGAVDQAAARRNALLWEKTTSSDDAGRFNLRGMASGAWLLNAEHPDFESLREVVELTGGGLREVELSFPERRLLVAVAGRVIDENGAGVAEAAVWLGGRGRRKLSRTRSFSDGRFELEAPRPGQYLVTVEHPEHATWRGEAIEVSAAGRDDLVLELGQGAVVEGEIRGLEPSELARVGVVAFHRTLKVQRAGVVDADGRYRLVALAAGEWSIHASAAPSHWVSRVDGSASSRTVSRQVQVGGSGDAVSADLVFAEGHLLTGRVVLDGQPLSGGQVTVHCESWNRRAERTRHDGRFEVADVPPGPCTVTVVVPNKPLVGSRAVEVAGDTDVVVELERSAIDGVVRGTVDGEGVAGARIELFTDVPGMSIPKGYSMAETVTDERGRFRVPGIARGAWRLRVTADGWAVAEKAIALTGLAAEHEIFLRPAAPAVLHVHTGDGEVPRYVTVSVLDESGRSLNPVTYQPEHDGRIVLRSLAPGRHRLRVHDRRGSSATLEIDVPGPSVHVVLELERAVSALPP